MFKKKKKTIFLLAFIITLSGFILLLPLNQNGSSNPPTPPMDDGDDVDLFITDLGAPLRVTHYARGEFYNQLNNTPGTIYATIPLNWNGTKAFGDFSQVSDIANWVQNHDFSGGTTGWNIASYDGGEGEASTGVQGGVFWMRLQNTWEYREQDHNIWCGGPYYYQATYEGGDYITINQTIPGGTFTRGNILNANLTFDFRRFWGSVDGYPNYMTISDCGGIKLLAFVEGSKIFDTSAYLAPYDGANNTLYNVDVSVPTAVFDTSDGIDIEFQMYVSSTYTIAGTVGDDANVNYKFGMFLDNIFLNLQAEAYPNDVAINLLMDGNAVSGAAYGNGNVTIIQNWLGSPTATTTVPFDITASKTTYFSADLDFWAQSVQGTKYTYSQIANGTHFTVESGQNVNWDFYVFGFEPSGYSDYHFYVDKPTDWAITNVYNPFEADILGQCDVGSAYLNVTPAAYNDIPGWYKIVATSSNYVNSTYTQRDEAGTWVNQKYVQPSNSTRVSAQILDGSGSPPSGITNTYAHVQISFPNGSLWLSEYLHPAATGWANFTSFTIPQTGGNAIAGNYSVVVTWNNSAGLGCTEAGRIDDWFVVTHATSLNARAGYETLNGLVGDTLYPRIEFTDIVINKTIREATIQGNWTSGPVTFLFLTSYYEAELDTSGLQMGTYYMVVNASKFAYDNAQTVITIELGYDTSLTSPQSPAVDVAWRANVTIEVDYTRIFDGAGINGCVPYNEITANWSASPGTDYTIQFIGNGHYEIELNTSSKSIGNYQLKITATKTGYVSQTLFLLVKIRARATSLSSPQFPLVSEYYNEYTTIFVTYHDEDGGEDVAGTVICNWTQDYSINPVSGGTYNVTIKTDLPIGDYYLNVTTTRPNYQQAVIIIKVRIIARTTDLTYDPTSAVPIDSRINITLYLFDGINSSPLLNTTSQLLFSVNSSLTGYWTIYDFNTGTYNLEVDTSAPVFTSPGNYYIDFSETWLGIPFYSNQSTLIRLTIRTISTSLLYDPPGQVPYGNYLNLTVHYTVSDSDSIYNGQGIGGAQINLSGYTYNTDYITLSGQSTGDYIIQIFNSTLNNIQIYPLTITAGGLTDYQSNNRNLDVTVRKLAGTINAQPVGTWPYGNKVNVTVQIFFDDSESLYYNGQGISGLTSSEIHVSGGHIYSITEGASGIYTITIENTTLLNIQSYSVGISFDDAATYTGDYTNISFTIRKLSTSITADPVGSKPYGNEVNITIHVFYNDPDSLYWDSLGITGLVKDNFSVSAPHDFSLTELSGGDYILTILNSTILDITSYTITITVADSDSYTGDNVDVSFSIRKLSTTLAIDPIGTHPYGNEVNITVRYTVSDSESQWYNAQGISGLTIANFTVSGGHIYSVLDQAAGNYIITIQNGTILSITTYSVTITVAPSQNISGASNTASFTIRKLSTSLTINPAGSQPYGNNVNLTVNVKISDPASLYWDNIGITGLVKDNFTITSPHNFTLVEESTAGEYTFIVSNSTLTTIQTYPIQIDMAANTTYTAASSSTTINVRKLSTSLTATPAGSIPYGNQVNITLHVEYSDSASSYYDGQGVTGLATGDFQVSGGHSFTITDDGNGDYTLTITNGTILDIQLYTITISLNDGTIYTGDNVITSFTIRKLSTSIVAQAVGSHPYGNEVNVSLTVTYNDPESLYWNGLGISGLVHDNFSITDGHQFTITEGTSAGDYTLTILNGTILGIQSYSPTISIAGYVNYTGSSVQTPFTIRQLVTSVTAEPIGAHPIGNDVNITIHVRYYDSASQWYHNRGITGLNSNNITLSGGYTYLITELTSGDYIITIKNDSLTNIQEYSTRISLLASQNYSGSFIDVSFSIRKLSASITIDPVGAAPYGNLINLTIHVTINDPASQYSNGLGITGLVKDNFTISSPHQFSVVEQPTAGEYIFTITNGTLLNIQSYPITIDMAASTTYTAASADTIITIRKLSTSITASPAGSKPLGNPVNITVHVEYSDGDSQWYDGLGITSLTKTNFTISAPHNFTIIELSNGDYIITILNTTILTIQSYQIMINFLPGTTYSGDSVQTTFSIRALATAISAQPVGDLPYGNEVNVSLQVTYADPESLYWDGVGISGLVHDNFSITDGHQFRLVEGAGAGDYTLIIENGTILTIQSYTPIISVTSYVNYTGSSTQISFTIRKLTTSLSASPIAANPYGNSVNISITVEYNDPVSQWYHNTGITGLSTSDFTITGGHSFSIVEGGNGAYTIIIENGTLLNIQAYSIQISLNEGATYQGSTVNFDFSIRNLITELSADLVPDQPFDEDVNISVHYSVNDPASLFYHNSGISGAQINITGWSYGIDYLTIDLGNGDYILALSKSKLALIGQYSLSITASNVQNYSSASTSSIFNVRAISTSFTYISPSPTPWGFNVTIDLTFKVEDSLSSQNTNPITSAYSITVNESNPTFVGHWVEIGGGVYQVELDTSALTSGTYIANITIYKENYVNRSVLITFNMIPHRTQVTYDIVDPSPWGQNTTITVYFLDIDNSSQRIHPVSSITLNESQSLGYNWVDDGDGSFGITIDTRDPEIWFVGTFKINVTIYQFDYQNSSTLISIIKKTRNTDIIYQTPDITPYQQNATIKFRYQDLDNSTTPVGINNNTNPQIPGLSNYAGNVTITAEIFDSWSQKITSAIYWIFSMESISGYGDGWYNLTIDTTSLGLIGSYRARINISWQTNSLYYNQTITIPFNVRAVTALLEYQPPGSVAYAEGGYIPVWLKYSDIDNSLPIDYATINITYIEDPSDTQIFNFIKGTNYTVEGYGVGDNDRESGWYLIKILMGQNYLNTFGSYDFKVRANKTNYDTREILNITFNIRQGFTQFTSPYAPESYIPDGFTNITLNYRDSESGIGIVNQSSGNVILIWSWPYNTTSHPNVTTLFGWSNTHNRWIPSWDLTNYPMGDDGRYQILLDASGLTVGDKFILSLTISAGPLVESKTLNITFYIEPQSSIMGMTYPLEVVWGVNSTFNVTYQKNDGTGIPGSSISLYDLDAGTSLDTAYYQVITLDNSTGLFQVIVNTTFKAPPVAGYHQIRVDATGAPYTPRSLNQYLRVRPIDSQVVITPSAATGYNELANVTIKYWDVYNSQPINDSNIQDYDDVIINITNIDSNYWNLYLGASNGYYIIEVNTSYWGAINENGFPILIDVLWEGVPYYQNWTALSIALPVRARSTDFSYTPPAQTPYGDNSSTIFTYRDIESGAGSGISNSSGQIIFLLYDSNYQLWNSSGFAWVIDQTGGSYQILINTSKLPTIGTYTFTAEIKWIGTPFYANRSSSFNITVRQINTILTYGIPPPTPWGNHLTVNLLFNISDSLSSRNGQPISTAILNITSISGTLLGPLSFTYGANYTVNNQGNGLYTLMIYNFSLNTVDSYTITIQASNYHINILYTNSSAAFSFDVRQLVTSVIISPIPDVPYGNPVNISLLVKYTDFTSSYHNNEGITGLNESDLLLAGGYVYHVIEQQNGNYIIQIENSSVLAIQAYSVNITLVASSTYASANALSSFNIRKLYTLITAEPVGSIPYGNEANITVHVTCVDPESLYYDTLGIYGLNSSDFNLTGGHSFNLYPLSGGDYIIQIQNSTLLNIASYDVTITVNEQATYTSNDVDISFNVRKLVATIGAQPLGEIPFGNEVNVSLLVRYYDSESLYYHLQGITSLGKSNFSITGGHDFTIIEGSNGNYIMSIHNNTLLTIQSYSEVISFGDSDTFTGDTTPVSFTIRKLVTSLTADPVGTIPFGNQVNITVEFKYNDPDSLYYTGPISGLVHDNFSVTGGHSFDLTETATIGTYILTIHNNTILAIQSYSFTISVAGSQNYTGSSTDTSFTIRKLQSLITIEPPAAQPWGNIVNLTIHVTINDGASLYWDGSGIAGLVKANFTLTGGHTFSMLELPTAGDYIITIQNGTLLNIQSYPITISMVAGQNYTSASSDTTIVVRKLIVSITSSPVGSIPYGNPVNITIHVEFTDFESQWYNGRGVTGLTTSDFQVSGGHSFTAKELSDGNYIITIANGTILSLQNYIITITVNETATYSSDSTQTSFTVRQLASSIVAQPIGTHPFGNYINVSLQVIYSDPESLYWDGVGITGLTTDNFSITDGHHITIDALGSGGYTMTIQNDTILAIQSYLPTISIGSSINYTGSSVQISFTIRKLVTLITADPVGSQPFGNEVNITVHAIYNDPASFYYHLDGIQNLSTANFTLTGGHNYIATEQGTQGDYLITISNDTLLTIQSYSSVISISDTQNYTGSSYNVIFSIRQLTTSLTTDPVGTHPYGNYLNISVHVRYSDPDSLYYDGIGISGLPQSNFSVTGGHTFDVVETGTAGDYILTIHNNTLLTIQTYVLTISIASSQNYTGSSSEVTLIIRKLQSLITIDPLAAQPWGNVVNLTIHVTINDGASLYWDRSGITGLVQANFSVTGSHTFSVIELPTAGDYIITIQNGSLLNIQSYPITISTVAGQTYTSASADTTIIIRKLGLSITSSPVGSIPFGNPVNITVHVEFTDFESQWYNGRGVTGLNTSDFQVSDGHSFTVMELTDGNYIITIANGTVLTIQTYIITITVNEGATYSGDNTQASFTIRKLASSIIANPIGTHPYGNQVNASLTLIYADPESLYWDGVGITGLTTDNFSITDGHHITVIELGSGGYTMTIQNDTILAIQSYSPIVSIGNSVNYTGSSVQISFTIRKLVTLITADPVGSQPFGNEINITAHVIYNDPASLYYHLKGIQNLSTANFTLTGGHIYIATEQSTPGDYLITISNDTLLTIQSYSTRISIGDTQNYTGSYFDVSFTIRALKTSITTDPIGTHPYGNQVNITIHVRYSDPDSLYYNGLGISGLPKNNFSISGGHNFNLIETATAGDYIFTILNNTILSIQSYILTITLAGSQNYTGSNTQASFTIRKLQSLITIDPITAQPYGNIVNLTVHVTVNDGASLYWDGLGITGLITANFSLTGGHTYSVTESTTAGNYVITIQNGSLLLIQSYPITISIAAGQNYTAASADTTIIIRKLIVSITTSPVASVPFGNPVNITVQVEYIDFDSQWYNGLGLTNLSTGDFQVSGGHSFTVTELGNGYYIITILNGTILNIQSYLVTITLNAGSTYYGDTAQASFSIRKLASSLIAQPLGSHPYGNEVNVSLTLIYADPESLYWDGVGITGLTKDNFSITDSHQITVIEGGAGSYTLTISNNTLLSIASYSPTISVGDFVNYTGSSTQITFSIRKLTTSLTNDPVGIIPYGNPANFTIHVKYLDPQSQYWDGIGITGLSNSNFTVTAGYNYNIVEIGGGDYYVVVSNDSLSNIQSYSMTIRLNESTLYESDLTVALITIRKLISIITADPIGAIPWGNYANITIHASYTDPASLYYDGQGIEGLGTANFTIDGGHSFSINEIGNGAYHLIIENGTLLTITSYSITLTLNDSAIYIGDDVNIAFAVRKLITSLLIYPIGSIPWGNYVNVTVEAKYSDVDSMWYQAVGIEGLVKDNFTVLVHLVNFVVELGNGLYIIQLANDTLRDIKSYTVSITLNSYDFYAQSSFTTNLIVRKLLTSLTIDSVAPVPYGNEVNLTTFFKVSDPDSYFWNNVGLNFTFIPNNYTIDGGHTFNITNLGNGYYLMTIHNDTLLTVKTYSVTVTVLGFVYWESASYSLTFEIRALHTALSYQAVPPWYLNTPWGDNVTVGMTFRVNDVESLYHHGELINNTEFEITSPAWQKGTDYIYAGVAGQYNITILPSAVPNVQLYYFDVKSYFNGPLRFDNATLFNIPFSVRKVYTSHSVFIGNESLPGYSGWPWGENITIRILYNDTDHPGNLVQNSNISVTGSSVYQNGNYTIYSFTNGTFIIEVDGSAGEHGVGYIFDVTLFTSAGTHLNETFVISVSFRKSVGQVFLKVYPLSVTWGDNITILFSYNNTEASNYPGIGDATVQVNVSDPLGENYFNVYNVSDTYGWGVWKITMNTTWAPVTPTADIPISFIIQAESRNTIYSETFHTVIIQAIEAELRVRDQDYSVYLDEVTSFNVTFSLRDRSHFNSFITNYNPIENNSQWINGSQGQYDDISFIIKVRVNYTWYEYTNYSWFWGSVDLTGQSQGNYTLRFNINETGYPNIQELLFYVIEIRATGKYIKETLDTERTIFTINLILRTHNTAMTFDWDYANTTIMSGANLSYFESFTNGSSYVYGDIINIYLFWYDLNINPIEGISPGNVKVSDWSQYYYRVFDLFDIHDNDPSYKGIYQIQLDTRQFGDITGNYTLIVNASLETFDRVYKLTQGIIQFEIDPVTTKIIDKRTPDLIDVPYGDDIEIIFNYTDVDHGEPIALRFDEVNASYIPGAAVQTPYAFLLKDYLDGRYALRFYSVGLNITSYNATIIIIKQNYQSTYVNFSFSIRSIRTKVEMIPDYKLNYTITYRHSQLLEFNYLDNDTYIYHTYHPYNTPIASNPNDPNLFFNVSTNWFDAGGTAVNVYSGTITGIYRINLTASVNVGVYSVQIFVNLTPYEISYKTITITVTPAESFIDVIEPAKVTNIYQLLEGTLRVRYRNEWNEPLNGTLFCLFLDSENVVVRNITLTPEGNGYYSAPIKTSGLKAGATYSLEIYAISENANYQSKTELKSNYITVKPLWEHPLFIILMVGVAAVAGAYGYRKVKWYLLPREVKAIEIAKKTIRKGKIIELPFRDIKDRELMFRSTYSNAWGVLGIKPPKLVRPEVVLFASELSAVIRTRVTTPEAESMINTLKTMSVEEATRYLSDRKVPPEATRRLLTIAGLIAKERMEVINFAQILGEIKDQEISYSQAENIMNTLQSMSPTDADSYLEAMVIPRKQRKKRKQKKSKKKQE
ncbi:MAG: beta strand repeat-containing protein [Candidatus Helarchaeota archaeon]